MANGHLPSPEVLRQLLRYEPETGNLFWKERSHEWFPTGRFTAEHTSKIWNTRYSGKEAFTCPNDAGYRTGRIFNVLMRAHRVIYAMHFNEWPQGEVDHINGDRSDNRLENLRDVDRTENSHNAAVHKDSMTGLIGISWYPRLGKWCARIYANGQGYHLGVYACLGQAIRASKEAERRHGFHANHGRAA